MRSYEQTFSSQGTLTWYSKRPSLADINEVTVHTCGEINKMLKIYLANGLVYHTAKRLKGVHVKKFKITNLAYLTTIRENEFNNVQVTVTAYVTFQKL